MKVFRKSLKLLLSILPERVQKKIKNIYNERIRRSGDPLIVHLKKYSYKCSMKENVAKEVINTFNYHPLISVIVPVYNTDVKWLDKAVKSVEKQYYVKWELCIADDHSDKQETIDYLKGLKGNKKIKVVRLEENSNISEASNAALQLCSGDYVALLDHDDELTPDALFEVVKAINENGAEFLYSDEDKLTLEGKYENPHYKPDYSPDHLLSQNYICHLAVIKRSLVSELGGFRKGYEGAQDYDLFLRVAECAEKIHHIPKILYHWRMIPGSTASEFSEKSYAHDAGKLALESAMKRRRVKGEVHNGVFAGTYRIKRAIEGNPLVSIIIPFKDNPFLLKKCLDSILDKSTYSNYEVLGVSNNSVEEETFELMKAYEAKDKRIKFVEYNQEFNYSAINNFASGISKGDHLILLNNDIEIISADWVESLLEHSQRIDVGVVGGLLYYPDDTIQHAGVIIGIGGVAGHSHKLYRRGHHGYFSRIYLVQNLSAVTGACMMVKKSLYKEVGGLNEELKVAFNDVDFCLRLQEKGCLNVYTPYCEAYHHESISRGYEDTPEKIKRHNFEINLFQKLHSRILKNGDPFYNKNLSLEYEDFSLK
ncbi:MAG: glycosyltransferase family 2 protein [Cytophagaceae bacterium]